MTPDEIKIGDTVRITESRLALPVSPYSQLYNELWQKYGHREGRVIAFADKSIQEADDPSCVIQFEEGDTVAWAIQHVAKVETERLN